MFVLTTFLDDSIKNVGVGCGRDKIGSQPASTQGLCPRGQTSSTFLDWIAVDSFGGISITEPWDMGILTLGL